MEKRSVSYTHLIQIQTKLYQHITAEEQNLYVLVMWKLNASHCAVLNSTAAQSPPEPRPLGWLLRAEEAEQHTVGQPGRVPSCS